jgi:hypothetical protein
LAGDIPKPIGRSVEVVQTEIALSFDASKLVAYPNEDSRGTEALHACADLACC